MQKKISTQNNKLPNSLPRVCFILPYFGKWPVWTPLFLESCSQNKGFTWLLFGNQKGLKNTPTNVKWQKMTLAQAIKKHLNEDVSKIKNDADAKKVAKKHGIDVKGVTKANIQDELMKLFRDKLIQPTFLTDYPIESSPLAKPNWKDPGKVEIFQPFIGGIELARAYSELNDPQLQEEHFKEQEH